MLTDNLVSFWKMDEESDGSGPVTRVDAHGPNDLSDAGNVYMPSVPGAFSGSGLGTKSPGQEAEAGWLEITDANQSGLNVGTQDFAVAFWWFLDITGYSSILGKYHQSAAPFGWGIFLFFNQPAIVVDNGAGGAAYPIFDEHQWLSPFDRWIHCVYNFDRDGTCDYWENGVKIQGVDISPYAAVDWSSAGEFQVNYCNFFAAWNQGYDEVGFWVGRTLTDDEIAELYNNGDGLAYPFGASVPLHLFQGVVN
jgi:hypothetical protein